MELFTAVSMSTALSPRAGLSLICGASLAQHFDSSWFLSGPLPYEPCFSRSRMALLISIGHQNVCFLSSAGVFHNYLFMILDYLLTQEKENPMRAKVLIFRFATFKYAILELKHIHMWWTPTSLAKTPLLPLQGWPLSLAKTSPILKSEIETYVMQSG